MAEPRTYLAPIDANQRRHWLRRHVPSAIECASRRHRPTEADVMAVMDRLLDSFLSNKPLPKPKRKRNPTPQQRAAERLTVLRRAAHELGIGLGELRRVLATLPSQVRTPAETAALTARAIERLNEQVAHFERVRERPARRPAALTLGGRYISPKLAPTPRYVRKVSDDSPHPDELPAAVNVTPIESRRRIQSGSFWMYPFKEPAVILPFERRAAPGRVYRKGDKLFIKS